MSEAATIDPDDARGVHDRHQQTDRTDVLDRQILTKPSHRRRPMARTQGWR